MLCALRSVPSNLSGEALNEHCISPVLCAQESNGRSPLSICVSPVLLALCPVLTNLSGEALNESVLALCLWLFALCYVSSRDANFEFFKYFLAYENAFALL